MGGRSTRTAVEKDAGRAKKGKGQVAMRRDEVEDILAEPLSSSEEEHENNDSGDKLKEPLPDVPSPAQKAQSARTSKAEFSKILPSPVNTMLSRRPLSPPPQFYPPPNIVKHEDADFFDYMAPSSPPKKRRKLVYGQSMSANIHTAVKTELKIEPMPTDDFNPPAALSTSNPLPPTSGFRTPPEVTSMTGRGTRKSGRDQTSLRSLSTPTFTALFDGGPMFNIPPALPNEPASSATSAAETIFDAAEGAAAAPLKRRGSTSSLSSLGSSASLDLSQEQKQALMHDDADDGLDGMETGRCQLCSARVELSFLQAFAVQHPAKLKVRDQQKFCLGHRQRRAQREWQSRGYPTIDWGSLEETSVSIHIPNLTQILRRKAPSFYRTKLDSAVRAAGSSGKGLQSYLKEGMMDVVKYGYYGSRGARVLGHAISVSMSEVLKERLHEDKLMRAAGVGGYVSAVLVPELLAELVKEDMGITDDAEARKILEDSVDLGTLLNGDEDEAVALEDLN